jgi:lysyl-tRNA synthetase, class II
MLESYEAYADYHDVMDLTEALVAARRPEALGTTSLTYQGREVSWPGPSGG